jgi:hypothetical protein
MNKAILDRKIKTRTLFKLLLMTLCLLGLKIGVLAQSTEIDFPTPVGESVITGTINARDIGDPRLTRHFYTLTGMPGDLTVTVESRNLDGDVDLFTVGTLRPLAKISLYAGENAARASKSIYLKRREQLILRVEARSPDENSGSYLIRFEGSFEPIIAETPQAESQPATVAEGGNRGGKTRRVSSVGARLEEPEEKPAAGTERVSERAAETAPQPTETAKTGEPAEAKPAEAKTSTEKPKPTRAPRSSRSRTPSARRRVPKPPPAEEKTEEKRVEARVPAQPATGKPPEGPAPQPEITFNPRLVIETRDGMRIERFMNTVRRVTVENGMVVVVTKEGKTERQPLRNILRMSIEP